MTKINDWQREVEANGVSENMRFCELMHIWQVTACWRQSSAMLDDSWYEEIFVWKVNPLNKHRELIADATGRNFWNVCRQIEIDGEYKEPNETD